MDNIFIYKYITSSLFDEKDYDDDIVEANDDIDDGV